MSKRIRIQGPQKLQKILDMPCFNGGLNLDEITQKISSGELTGAGLYHLGNLLTSLGDIRPDKISAEVVSALTSTLSLDRMRPMRRALYCLYVDHPLLRLVDDVIASRSAHARKAYKPRARRYSVSPSDLPADWQRALDDMRAGIPGMAGTVPAPSLVTSTAVKICELAHVARSIDSTIDLTIDVVSRYEKSLVHDRKLRPATILSSLRQIRDFAKYIGADDEILDHLAVRLRIHENRAHGTIPLKEAKIVQLPDFTEIFEIAFDLLGKSHHARHPKYAQKYRNTAVALALTAPFPLRVADTQLRFGREITWDGTGYELDFVSSKMQRRYRAPVIPIFSWWIDQLVLQGAGAEHLQMLRERCIATKRPLFVRYDGKPPHPRYVSYLWQCALGTGCHAARTHLHDQFAALGTRGVELALRACGQRSERTAEAYRTRAFEFLAIQKVHTEFSAGISDAEWKEFFSETAIPEIPKDSK